MLGFLFSFITNYFLRATLQLIVWIAIPGSQIPAILPIPKSRDWIRILAEFSGLKNFSYIFIITVCHKMTLYVLQFCNSHYARLHEFIFTHFCRFIYFTERTFSAASIFNTHLRPHLSDRSIDTLFSACLLFTGSECWFQLKSTVTKFIIGILVWVTNEGLRLRITGH